MSQANSPLDLSIVIPFKDKSELTVPCINSLQRYGDACKEILLVSNNSSAAELERTRQAAQAIPNAKLLVYDEPFNFQKINNWAIEQSTGKVCMMLNNDIELVPQSRGLLKKMYDKALEPAVGTVGCVLLYEDRRSIQHAGVYLVPGGTADALYAGQNYQKVLSKIGSGAYKHNITANMRVSAVTAAAVMMERKKFDEINGLNEDFIICGGDVDLCLRAEEHHYSNWLIGSESGYMIHKESKSRSMLAVPYIDFVESYKSYVRHFDAKQGDPYLNWETIQHEK